MGFKVLATGYGVGEWAALGCRQLCTTSSCASAVYWSTECMAAMRVEVLVSEPP